MVIILRAEVDKLKMHAKEKEYLDGFKDGEDEEDEDTGDWAGQDCLAECCVGDRVGDGGCGSDGAPPAAMIDGGEIRGGKGGANNDMKDGVKGNDDVDLLNLDVMNWCVM